MKSLEHWDEKVLRARVHLDWLTEIHPRVLNDPNPTFLPNEVLRTMPVEWEVRLATPVPVGGLPGIPTEVRRHVRRWWRREYRKALARVAYCDSQRARRKAVVRTVWDHLGRL